MSHTIDLGDNWSVTRYTGPGDLPDPERIRLQILGPRGYVYGIDQQTALAIAGALLDCVLDIQHEKIKHATGTT